MAQQHQVANTETWNGTSWTEVNDLNTSMQQLAGDGTAAGSAGTQTAALATPGGNPIVTATEFLGNSESQVANTETWDGTSWTEVGDLNNARSQLGSSELQHQL